MPNRNPKGVEWMCEIAQLGGKVGAARRMETTSTLDRMLIGVLGARARWGKPPHPPYGRRLIEHPRQWSDSGLDCPGVGCGRTGDSLSNFFRAARDTPDFEEGGLLPYRSALSGSAGDSGDSKRLVMTANIFV